MQTLTIAEKSALCSGADNWRTKSFAGISSVRMADGPHGVRMELTGEDGKPHTRPSVCFPCLCLLAASFDTALARTYGETLAGAARSVGADVILAPGVNIKRSPLCGRNFEYLSEDPLVAGRLAAELISGMQGAGVGAVIKHFAMNNQEKARLSLDVSASERTKREIYFRPFEIAVKESNPWAVMTAYNKIAGKYCSENPELLAVLRRDWGFDGLVMSDWGGVHDRVRALRAGTDLEMPFSGGYRDREIERAAGEDAGVLACLERSAARVADFAARAEAARALPEPRYDEAEAHEAARRIARESFVLLKNDEGLLPFSKNANPAVIGAFAEKPRYQGGGAANMHPTRLKSFTELLREKKTAFTFARGYFPDAEAPDAALIAEAVSAAKAAEAALIFAGTPVSYESEGYDRPHMRLPEAQNRLIEAVAAACPNTVVALFAGSALEMPWIKNVKSVLFCYLPGQAGAEAISDCLFGGVSPSGKLPETFPARLEDTPCFGSFGRERTALYDEGAFVGYRHYASRGVEPLFPFGHGLSYTDFAYDGLEIAAADCGATVSFNVTNTGGVAAAEATQLYVVPPADEFRPALELRAFGKVFLQPNETARLVFPLTARDFAVWGDNMWRVPGGVYRILAGSSSADIRLKGDTLISGEAYSSSDDLPAALEHRVRPFTPDTTLGELRKTFIGRRIYNAVTRGVVNGGNAGEQEGQDLSVMLLAQADYLTIDALITYTKGAFTADMLDGLLTVLNGRRICGLRQLFLAWRANKRQTEDQKRAGRDAR